MGLARVSTMGVPALRSVRRSFSASAGAPLWHTMKRHATAAAEAAVAADGAAQVHLVRDGAFEVRIEGEHAARLAQGKQDHAADTPGAAWDAGRNQMR